MTTETTTQAISVSQLRAQIRSQSLRALGRTVGRSAITALVTFAIVLVIWLAAINLFGVSHYVTKSPLDVFNFLFTVPLASENRSELVDRLGVTLTHASVGFLVGLVVSVVVAIVFRLSKGAESALMPFALLLRSVPLIALAPVIILIFGLGSPVSVAVIGGIVVLFPALVTITFGLKNASPQMLDVVSVYGGSTFTAVRKVALPGALPSLFAAIRISVPGAITGALLSEMLSTGGGIGYSSLQFIAQAKFNDMWANVVSITAVSLVLYTVVQLIEAIVLARMGMVTERREN